jgi:hypothetical protein
VHSFDHTLYSHGRNSSQRLHGKCNSAGTTRFRDERLGAARQEFQMASWTWANGRHLTWFDKETANRYL